MRVKQLDPAVWVIVALVGATLVITLMVLAARGCVQVMKEGFESVSTGLSSYEQTQWATEAEELEPAEYAAFAEKAQAIDLGIGVHLGADMEHVEAVLGAADTIGRAANGGYVYTYMFLAGAEGPSSKQRLKGGFFAIINSASLALTAIDGKVTSITFFASPLSSDDAGLWAFLTLNDKPLTQCTKDDLSALLGEPTEATRYNVTWRYTLTSPVAESTEFPETGADDETDVEDSTAGPVSTPEPDSGILVHAMIDPDTGLLFSLEIRER